MFNVIVAVSRQYNGKLGIGTCNRMAWKCVDELKLFKKKTMGHVLIMGKSTVKNLPRLDGREIYCLSQKYAQFNRCNTIGQNTVRIFNSFPDAIRDASELYPDKKIFVAGGEQIYQMVMTNYIDYIDELHISYMKQEYACDKFFNFYPSYQNCLCQSYSEHDEFISYVIKPNISNKLESSYLSTLNYVMQKGHTRNGRNGEVKSIFSRNLTFNLEHNKIPLLTTKKMFFRGIVEELLFFIRGQTNSKLLEEKGINIWKANTTRQFLDQRGLKYDEGEMGPMYGYQWRNFNGELDQLQKVIDQIKNNPESRRILLTDYNPLQAEQGVLYPCFLANTIVLTENGYKFIQNVEMTDKLLSHTGKFQHINSIQKTLYKKGDILELNVAHHPHTIKTTPEHPFYVKEVTFIKKRYKTVDVKTSEPQWVEAKNLKSNHYIGMKINKHNIVPKFTFTKTINQHKTNIIHKTLDNEDEWFLLGYFLGDGWIEWSRQGVFNLVFCYDDEELIDTLLTRLGITHSYKNHNHKLPNQSKTFVCTNFELWNILKDFGHLAHNKRIPEWVQNAPINYVQKFIDGYTKADGCYTNRQELKYTTVSKSLAFGLQRLYLKLGKVLPVCYQDRKPTCVIQGRTVNQHGTYSSYWKEPEKTSSFYVLEDDYIWYKIRNIDECIYSNPITVYNFDVDNDHTYCVENLLVHNCHSIMIQFYVEDTYLDMKVFNRSSDLFLGLPFNIASSSLLLILIAKTCNLKPRNLHIDLGDAHIYQQHMNQAKDQCLRIPYQCPTLRIEKDLNCISDIENLTFEDFILEDYNHHSAIKAKMVA